MMTPEIIIDNFGGCFFVYFETVDICCFGRSRNYFSNNFGGWKFASKFPTGPSKVMGTFFLGADIMNPSRDGRCIPGE